jgi:uncharacterized protein YcnI
MKKQLFAALAAATVTAAIYAPFAGAHATANLLLGQPTAASTATWFLRVPNERPNKSTFKVTMNVPTAIQQSISVRQTPGWKMTFTRQDTGQKDGEGNAIYNTTQVTWQASKGNLIAPGMYQSFEFRFKAPSTPTSSQRASPLRRGRTPSCSPPPRARPICSGTR